MPALLDQFIPRPDVREQHETMVAAPAELVFEVACHFDMRSPLIIRAIFWLREKLLGAKKNPARKPQGIVAETLNLGWGKLAEAPGRYFIAGAACQPWQADVIFSPIAPEQFATDVRPDAVKIAWTLEAEAISPARTRFVTETRVVATDDEARAKFRRYWRIFGMGIVFIRWLLLPAVRRQAERRWQELSSGVAASG